MIDSDNFRIKRDRVVEFLREKGHVIDVSTGQTDSVVVDGQWRTFAYLFDIASQDPDWLKSEDEFNKRIVGRG